MPPHAPTLCTHYLVRGGGRCALPHVARDGRRGRVLVVARRRSLRRRSLWGRPLLAPVGGRRHGLLPRNRRGHNLAHHLRELADRLGEVLLGTRILLLRAVLHVALPLLTAPLPLLPLR